MITKVFKDKGSTLAEVMVSLLILQAILVAIIPSFVYANKQTAKNRLKAIISNLGNEQLERIKGMEYENIGLLEGNPGGTLTAEQDISENGYTFHLSTRVQWIDDTYDGTAESDSNPNDYKLVTLTLTELSGLYDKPVVLHTNISQEYEEQPLTGGNIDVTVTKPDLTPIDDATVNILTGPSAPISSNTNSTGTTLFAGLTPSAEPGDYSLTVSKPGYIVQPNIATQYTTLDENGIKHFDFIMDQASSLIVHLVDDDNNPIDNISHIELNNPETGKLSFDSSNGEYNVSNVFPGEWNITASTAAYETNTKQISIEPGTTAEITIKLTSLPKGILRLIVKNSVSSQVIADADVLITNNGVTFTGKTDSSGILETELSANMNIKIEINKAGYYPKSMNVDSIVEGTITATNALIDPSSPVGSVKVAVIDDSQPAAGVQIKLVSKSSTEEWYLTTGIEGTVLFNNVAQGNYNVYRWWKNGWKDKESITVSAGLVTIITYD